MKTFRDFMERALYDPQTGYYPRRVVKRDFYTAPELHPAFGACLAEEIGRRLGGARTLVEAGCGNGTLFRSVLEALAERDSALVRELRCVLVERAEPFLKQALEAVRPLAPAAEGLADQRSLAPFDGVLFSNELVDALPVHVLEKKDDEVLEVYVEGGLATLGPLSSPDLEPFARKAAARLGEGDRTAVPLDALRWLRLAAGQLRSGAIITVDFGRRYGGAPYLPKTYFRHVLGDDPLQDPGERDITVPVDFDVLIEEGEKLGLSADLFQPLGRFLLDRGILEKMPAGDDPASYKERNKIKTLFHPDGMGESFKVLVQAKAGH